MAYPEISSYPPLGQLTVLRPDLDDVCIHLSSSIELTLVRFNSLSLSSGTKFDQRIPLNSFFATLLIMESTRVNGLVSLSRDSTTYRL